MGTDARATRRLARRASSRDLRRRAVRGCGVALLYGAGVSLVLACSARGLGVDSLSPLVLAVPPGAFAIAALAVAWARRWDERRAAIELDHALGLKDRLSSALDFSREPRGDPAFVELAIRDAERVAEASDARAIGPVRWTWPWAAWPTVLALVAAAWLWFPRLLSAPRARGEELNAEVATTADEIRQAADLVRSAEPSLVPERAAIDDLEALEAELRGEGVDPKTSAARAASIADESAARAADRGRRESEAADIARRALSEAAREVTSDDGAAELREALGEADLAAAREAAAAMRERAAGMSPKERAALANDLRALAEALREDEASKPGAEQTTEQTAEQPAEHAPASSEFHPSPELTRALEEQGLTPEDIEQLAKSPNAESAREELNREGVDPAAASELAERLEQERREAEAQETASEDVTSVADAMRQAADELERPSSPPDGPTSEETSRPEPSTPGDAQPREAQSPDATTPKETKPSDSAPGSDQAQPNEPQGERRSSDGSKPTEGSRPDSPQTNPATQAPQGQPRESSKPGTEPAQRDTQATGKQNSEPAPGTAQKNTQTPGQPDTKGQRQGGSKPAGEPTGESTTEPTGEHPGDERKVGQQQQPGDEGPGNEQHQPGSSDIPEGETPGEGMGENGEQEPAPEPADGFGRLERRLERIADRERRARDAEREARQLEEQARRLWERASPSERRELEGWQQAFDRERPVEPPTELDPKFMDRQQDVFDARSKTAGGEARYSGELPKLPSDSGPMPAWRSDPIAQAREAAQSAERAIEQQAVPRDRTDLVRRVFQRLSKRTSASPPEGSPRP